MEDDIINQYKQVCGEFFKQQGLTVLYDVPVSDSARWRPHIYAKNKANIILDILSFDQIPKFYLKKYVETRNILPKIQIYLGLVGNLNYFFNTFVECAKYGIGIYKIDSTVKLLLEATEPTIEGVQETGIFAITSDRPYRNILSFKKCLRSCHKHLYWLEKNFPKKIFEMIFNAIEDNDLVDIDNIKLLRAIDDKITKNFREEFSKFQSELRSKGISVQLRILKDTKISGTIHGRFIYSKKENDEDFFVMLPPINSLKADQWDNILTKVVEPPPFEELWNHALDIRLDWNELDQLIKHYLKRKIAFLENQIKNYKERAQ